MSLNLVQNAAGRLVPTEINGLPAVPYQGVGKFRPTGRKAAPPLRSSADYPADGNKIAPDLTTALRRAGLRAGMTISSHHHFRDGDKVACAVFDAAAALGVKDLRWFPSAAFSCHEPLIRHIESGVIHHVEGSMNGPLGDYCSRGHMRGMSVLRSHGGRWQAVQDGEVHIDIAVIGAPTADPFGNANGVIGPSACGLLGYAAVDAEYADHVIVATDHLVPFPCVPWQIQGGHVDQVVVMESIGDPGRIVSGTTEITRSPDRRLVAELAARFVRDAGIMKPGWSFQAGAGGTSLAFTTYLKDMMSRAGITARFAGGGGNAHLVEMLQEGLVEYILDLQAFDLDAVRSIRDNRTHVAVTPFNVYNYHGKGCSAAFLDAAVLGATEVDLDFNANVVTHSDGRLLHGIGGWQNCLGARCSIIAVPSVRDRIPVVVDRVTTLCGPGELVDVVVTERGIAINPRRRDLLDAVKGSDLPIRTLESIAAEVHAMCGKPSAPVLADKIVAAIKWVDGTVIDCVRAVCG